MKRSVTITELYDILEEAIQDVGMSFAESVHETYKSPLFTLISIALSARTKDTLTMTKMPALWQAAKATEDYIKMPVETLEKLLKPINFYPAKAQRIKAMCLRLRDVYNNTVPSNMDDLLTLPGVGRKTANLAQSVIFSIPSICVDTHVHRIMNYIGYVKTKTPEETEKILRQQLPKKLWLRTNRILVLVGQNLANHHQIINPENILNQYELVD
jgi:endonuclease III